MIRISSGEFCGRKIKTLEGDSTRPTQARLRQAWLNSVQMGLTSASVLDLYSGSGALGLEALSRGAARVVFVESSPVALRVIKENCLLLGVLDRVKLIGKPVEKSIPLFLKEGPFDFIFADPPYLKGLGQFLLRELPWSQLLELQGVFCLEVEKPREEVTESSKWIAPPGLIEVRRKDYGESLLIHFQLEEREG